MSFYKFHSINSLILFNMFLLSRYYGQHSVLGVMGKGIKRDTIPVHKKLSLEGYWHTLKGPVRI